LNNFLHNELASTPTIRYISAHEIRNEHQLLVVAGPIVRSLVFLLRYLKDAGSFEREPIFLKKTFGCPAKRPELKRYNLKRKIK
jgi:hypothetical protein